MKADMIPGRAVCGEIAGGLPLELRLFMLFGDGYSHGNRPSPLARKALR